MNEQEKDLYITQLEEENSRLKQSNKSLRTNNVGLMKGIDKLNKRFAKYKKERQNGTLVKFPCAPGTIIYHLSVDFVDGVKNYHVVEEILSHYKVHDSYFICYGDKTGPFNADLFGDLVFFSHDKANDVAENKNRQAVKEAFEYLFSK